MSDPPRHTLFVMFVVGSGFALFVIGLALGFLLLELTEGPGWWERMNERRAD